MISPRVGWAPASHLHPCQFHLTHPHLLLFENTAFQAALCWTEGQPCKADLLIQHDQTEILRFHLTALPEVPTQCRENQFSSVQLLSNVWLFATPWTAACQASSPSPTSGAYSNSCPLSRWCHPAISSSVVHFSSCLQCFPASESFPMIQFFASGGQSIGVSSSASVLAMNIQDWFPSGLTGLIPFQSKGL